MAEAVSCRFKDPDGLGADAATTTTTTTRDRADDRRPASARSHRRKHTTARSAWAANEDRQPESPTPWEDVEDVRPPRIRKTRPTSSSRDSSAAAAAAPGKSSSSSSSSLSSSSADRSSTGYLPELSRIAEADGGAGAHYCSKSTAAAGSPHASRRSGSGVDLGASSSRRTIRHKHSSLLRRADALSQLSNPSLLSVFSSLTHSSGTSSGSNSTVTQKSYERSNITKRRRPKDRSSKQSESQGSTRLDERSERRRRRSSQPAHHVVEHGPAASSSESPSVDYSAPPRKPSAVARDRVNSDSGISVRDSSPEATERRHMAPGQSATRPSWDPQDDDEDGQRQLAIQRLYQELAQDPQALEAADDRLLQKLMSQQEQLRQHVLRSPPHARDEPRFHSDHSPRGPPAFPYYHTSQPQSGPYWDHPDPPPPAPHVTAPDPSYHRAASYGQFPPPSPQGWAHSDPSKTTITGYEKLAAELAASPKDAHGDDGGHSIRPLYRRFEYLNHRILLHMQDELSELEEELRVLDECIAQRASAAGEDGRAQPASRRLESRYGTDLHARRTLLLGSIYVKVGQYNNTMAAYGKMLGALEPAQADEISAYESWMRRHAPIEETETRFLGRRADLMSFRQRAAGVRGGDNDMLQAATLALPLFLLLPLIAFSQVPSVGGRLFMLAVLGAAEAAVVSSTRFHALMSAREWGICAAAYSALMAVVAVVV